MPIATVLPSDKSFADLSRLLMVVSMDKCFTSDCTCRASYCCFSKISPTKVFQLNEDNDIRISKQESRELLDKNRNVRDRNVVCTI